MHNLRRWTISLNQFRFKIRFPVFPSLWTPRANVRWSRRRTQSLSPKFLVSGSPWPTLCGVLIMWSATKPPLSSILPMLLPSSQIRTTCGTYQSQPLEVSKPPARPFFRPRFSIRPTGQKVNGSKPSRIIKLHRCAKNLLCLKGILPVPGSSSQCQGERTLEQNSTRINVHKSCSQSGTARFTSMANLWMARQALALGASTTNGPSTAATT